jgi:hypothetical protein
LLLALLLLAGCIPQADRPAEPGYDSSKLPATVERPETRQCHAELRQAAVEFQPLPDRVFGGGCSAIGAVQLLSMETPVTNLGSMTCQLAREFARWSQETVQDAAQRHLGTRVATIESFGTYSCRPVNGVAGGKLSEHGRSNAIDVAAFLLEDGRRITVEEGWDSGDERVRRFLRAVHEAGCRQFQIGLGPDANAHHSNHFHFDMGQGPYCR